MHNIVSAPRKLYLCFHSFTDFRGEWVCTWSRCGLSYHTATGFYVDPEREIYCLELLKTIFDWQNQATMINRQKSSAYCD